MTMIVERTPRRRTSKPFYTGMAIILAAIVFLGFSPTFYLRGYVPLPPGEGPLSPLLVVHGLVNTLWFALFLVQALLIKASRTDLHRRLGVLGAVVAVAVVVLGTMTTVAGVREGATPDVDPRVFFLGATLPAFVLFGSLVAAAIGFRRRPQTHKHLMLLATITLMGAGLDRVFPFVFHLAGPVSAFLARSQLATDIFVLAAVVRDVRSRGRVHPALIWGGAALVLRPLLLFVAGTPAGLALADRFR
jgi:hypothetical protein